MGWLRAAKTSDVSCKARAKHSAIRLESAGTPGCIRYKLRLTPWTHRPWIFIRGRMMFWDSFELCRRRWRGRLHLLWSIPSLDSLSLYDDDNVFFAGLEKMWPLTKRTARHSAKNPNVRTKEHVHHPVETRPPKLAGRTPKNMGMCRQHTFKHLACNSSSRRRSAATTAKWSL